jgi:ABC-type Mn2+/Zn2+ transport system permease subunit
MDWLTEPFTQSFMLQALLGGSLAAVTTALIGTWMVLRGLTFMGDALAHGILPGIAVAFLLDGNLVAGAVVGALVMVAGIHVVHQRAGLPEDVGIGLLFVGMLALGVVIISRSGSFTVGLTSVLFGDVLGTTASDLVLLAVTAAVTAAVIVAFHRGFLAVAFNPEKARLLGLYPAMMHLIMLTLIALAIVTSFRPVGALLVFAMLVAPPSTAVLLVQRVPAMMVTTVAIGAVSVFVGLLVSFHVNTATSATIAVTAVAIFFVTLTVRESWRRLHRPSSAGPGGASSSAPASAPSGLNG